MRWNLLGLSLAAAFAIGQPLAAAADGYKIDKSHARVGFKVKHMMASWVIGEFTEFEGDIRFDPENVENSAVDITVFVESVDTHNAKRDGHLRAGDFFAAQRHPEMTFVSREVRNVTDTSFQLVGDLTLRSVTNEVVLEVTWPGRAYPSPMGGLVYGFHGEAVIDRTEFGVDFNMPIRGGGGLVIGEEVTIEIDLELKPRK